MTQSDKTNAFVVVDMVAGIVAIHYNHSIHKIECSLSVSLAWY